MTWLAAMWALLVLLVTSPQQIITNWNELVNGVASVRHEVHGLKPKPLPDPEQFVAPVVLIESSNGWKGSGVFVGPHTILTVAHVVKDITTPDKSGKMPTISVTLHDNTKFDVVGNTVHPGFDLGTITTKQAYTGHTPSVSCVHVPRGTNLINVGNPGALDFVLTHIMSTGGWAWSKMPADAMNGVYLFEGPSVGGQSGSPIYSEDGAVVGVLDLTLVDDQGRYGIGGYVGLENPPACQFAMNALMNPQRADG